MIADQMRLFFVSMASVTFSNQNVGRMHRARIERRLKLATLSNTKKKENFFANYQPLEFSDRIGHLKKRKLLRLKR
jgi:hypothetical protein